MSVRTCPSTSTEIFVSLNASAFLRPLCSNDYVQDDMQSQIDTVAEYLG